VPVFRSGPGLAPDWCELEYFEIVRLPAGSRHTFARRGGKEKLIVAGGGCLIAFSGNAATHHEGANLDLTAPEGQFEVLRALADTTVVRMCGRWGELTGGSGLFEVTRETTWGGAGDPVDYAKETKVDNHYHDCDEYWIFFEGSGVAVSEGKHYEVGPGDCVATRAGGHHDFPRVSEPAKGVYFETSLLGRKRVATSGSIGTTPLTAMVRGRGEDGCAPAPGRHRWAWWRLVPVVSTTQRRRWYR